MFRAILVPLDGSSLAEAALPHAAAIATAFNAPLRLFRVIPVRQRGGAAPLDTVDRRLGQAEAGAYLDALAGELRDRGLRVETEVAEGNPADRIVESLRALETDLVVLTTHGSGGGSEFPISGTAHKVASRAGISVLMVPTSEGALGSLAPETGYRRVLVGLNGSQRGDWAIGPAATFARHAGAELVLAHVLQVPETVGEASSPEVRRTAEKLVRLNRQAAAQHLEAAKSRLETPGLQVRTRIEVSAHPPEALADLADSEKADLVVLTAHGASASTRRPYGGVALQVLAEARRPLLIVQDAPHALQTPRSRQAQQRAGSLNRR